MTTEYRYGYVKSVLSGDTLVVSQDQFTSKPSEYQVINLDGVRAPSLGIVRGPSPSTSDENKHKDAGIKEEGYAWESRFFLAKLVLGKQVAFIVKKVSAKSANIHADVYLPSQDAKPFTSISMLMLSAGLLSMKALKSSKQPANGGALKTVEHDAKLAAAYEIAVRANLGIQSPQAGTKGLKHVMYTPTKKDLAALADTTHVAFVDGVFPSSNNLSVILFNSNNASNCAVTIRLSGINMDVCDALKLQLNSFIKTRVLNKFVQVVFDKKFPAHLQAGANNNNNNNQNNAYTTLPASVFSIKNNRSLICDIIYEGYGFYAKYIKSYPIVDNFSTPSEYMEVLKRKEIMPSQINNGLDIVSSKTGEISFTAVSKISIITTKPDRKTAFNEANLSHYQSTLVAVQQDAIASKKNIWGPAGDAQILKAYEAKLENDQEIRVAAQAETERKKREDEERKAARTAPPSTVDNTANVDTATAYRVKEIKGLYSMTLVEILPEKKASADENTPSASANTNTNTNDEEKEGENTANRATEASADKKEGQPVKEPKSIQISLEGCMKPTNDDWFEGIHSFLTDFVKEKTFYLEKMDLKGASGANRRTGSANAPGVTSPTLAAAPTPKLAYEVYYTEGPAAPAGKIGSLINLTSFLVLNGLAMVNKNYYFSMKDFLRSQTLSHIAKANLDYARSKRLNIHEYGYYDEADLEAN